MKVPVMVLLGAAILPVICAAADTPELKDRKDKVSYSVGYQVGGDFKKQGVELDPELLLKGVQDALSGAEPLVSRQEMNKTLVDLKRKIVAEEQVDRKKAAEKNLKEGKEFLDRNAKKEGVVTLPSGLQYKVLQEGTGPSPKADDNVTVHYRGALIDGTEFDSSYKRAKPAAFRADRVIPGWKEALPLMKAGSRWQLFVPANLAYGERGAGPVIGPNSALVFEVELVSVQSAP